jgi:hypothetical protein
VAAGPGAPAAAPPAAPAAPQGGSGRKIVLIVVLVIVVLFVLAGITCASCAFFARRMVHVDRSGRNASISTPMGSISTNEGGALKMASDMGIEVYPGATANERSSASVNIGGASFGAAVFETDDPADKVGDFYRGKYPNAMFSTRDEHSQSIVVKTDKGAIAVVVESLGEGRRTKISISRWEGVAPPK